MDQFSFASLFPTPTIGTMDVCGTESACWVAIKSFGANTAVVTVTLTLRAQVQAGFALKAAHGGLFLCPGQGQGLGRRRPWLPLSMRRPHVRAVVGNFRVQPG